MPIHSEASVLPRVIGAIGESHFAQATAHVLMEWLDFDLAAIVLHPSGDMRSDAALLFDNFATAGAGQGLDNYLQVTRRFNPLLRSVQSRPGAYRARDFRLGTRILDDAARPYLIESDEEELGYRTLGWPERLEEVGLYFAAEGGLIELGFYRERGRASLAPRKLRELADLGPSLSAAFERQRAFLRASPQPAAPLSTREREVASLLLQGCGSEAIALRLGISLHTVKDHRKQIFRKLRIGSLAELFALHHPRNAFEIPARPASSSERVGQPKPRRK